MSIIHLKLCYSYGEILGPRPHDTVYIISPDGLLLELNTIDVYIIDKYKRITGVASHQNYSYLV